MLIIVGSAIIARTIEAFRAFVPLETSIPSALFAAMQTAPAKRAINIANGANFGPFPMNIFSCKSSPTGNAAIIAMGMPMTAIAAAIKAPPWF